MTRTLNSPVADARSEMVYLYQIEHSGGILRLTNASADITALSETWTAVGGGLLHDAVRETDDRRGQGVRLTMSGVDQTIISAILNNNFRGFPILIYLLHFDPDTGVQDTPDLLVHGRQNSDFKVVETRDPDSDFSGGRVTVTTRITSDLAEINQVVSVRSSVASHQEMIRRSGVASPVDTFFERVASLANRTIHWGTDTPVSIGRPGGVPTGRRAQRRRG